MEGGEFYEGGAVQRIKLLFAVTKKDHMSERKLALWSFFSVQNGV